MGREVFDDDLNPYVVINTEVPQDAFDAGAQFVKDGAAVTYGTYQKCDDESGCCAALNKTTLLQETCGGIEPGVQYMSQVKHPRDACVSDSPAGAFFPIAIYGPKPDEGATLPDPGEILPFYESCDGKVRHYFQSDM